MADSEDWTILFHTVGDTGGEPGDREKGHDWSISYKGQPVFYEHVDDLDAGEARTFSAY